MKIGIDIFGPTVSLTGLDTEIEFTSLYGITAALCLRKCDHTVYVSSDSADSTRATRQNSRHLNLVMLCQAGEGDCGAIIVHPRTSLLNRRRAEKAAIYLSHQLGHPFIVKNATHEDKSLEKLRPYKAFAWSIQPLMVSDPFFVGQMLTAAVHFAYDIQRESTRCAG